MIKFVVSTGLTGSKVVFQPRPGGAARGWKEIERDLVYGYVCQFCSNPIAFAFLSEQRITLGRYEETRVVNGERDCRCVIPGEESEYTTAYDIDWMPVSGKKTGIERVYMKNHVLRAGKIGAGEPFEPGERCCPYAGVFSLRKDLLMRDSIILGGFPSSELNDYNLPSWDQFESMIEHNNNYEFFIHGVGNPISGTPPPIVAARMDWIKEERGAGHWRGKLLSYKKSDSDKPNDYDF
jgi:hypothetical protein